MAEQAPRWRFARMIPAQINEDPVQGEFFTSASDLPERLVRESIQNSLDAAMEFESEDGPEKEQVRVRFAFSGDEHALDATSTAPYLSGLRRHFEAVNDEEARQLRASSDATDRDDQSVREAAAVFRGASRFEQPLTYLLVEDFGTKGLTGDIEANGSRELNNNFWGFFRQIGIPTKGQNAAGSWGLGKWVFPDASDINSYLAVTRRQGEAVSHMMGLATLKTHSLDGGKYPAYGHFAAGDDADDTHWLQMPVSSADDWQFVRNAMVDFQLERGEESGLSVIIPWPNEELKPSTIARAVITQYFLPIILGVLEIEITHPGEDPRMINEQTIMAEIGRMDEREGEAEETRASMRAIVDLADWAYGQDEDAGHVHIDVPTRGGGGWPSDADEEQLEELRERYNRGERLAFMLTVPVQHKSAATPQPSLCCLYIEKDESLAQGHDYYVRGNLQIPDIDTIRSHKARSLLLVDEKSELGHLLRDAENPAHTNWQPTRDRVRQSWRSPGRPIEQVRLAPRRILQALLEQTQELQLDALADLFPADIAMPRSQVSIRRRNNRISVAPVKPTPSMPGALRLGKTTDGFRLTENKDFELDLPGSSWRMRVAYEVARGTTKKAFSVFDAGVKDNCPDFSLSDGLSMSVLGCDVEIEKPNQLVMKIREQDFSVSVSGFDPFRDVIVEVVLIPDSETLLLAGG